jgi:CheY-like chemotaxis protein
MEENSIQTGPQIIVVDDNRDAAYMLKLLLTLKGYETHASYGGREGLADTERLRPKFVVMDLGMPEMDGFETARQIRLQSWGQDMILIALTGYGQEEDKRQTKAADFNAHLIKPVDIKALLDLLNTYSS